MALDCDVDVYRVGVLYALHFDWRAWKISRRKPTAIRHELRLLRQLVKARNWRRFRQQFHGWHAEHRYAHLNAGWGWTRRLAEASLRRNLRRHRRQASER